MSSVKCSRCANEGEFLAKPPFPGALGEKIHKAICSQCWETWMGESTKIINEYRLQLFRPEHREVLEKNMRAFLNLPD